MDPTLPYELA